LQFFFHYYGIHDILIDFMKYETVGSFVCDYYMTHVVFSVVHDTCLSFVVNIDTYIDLSSYVRTRAIHVLRVYILRLRSVSYRSSMKETKHAMASFGIKNRAKI